MKIKFKCYFMFMVPLLVVSALCGSVDMALAALRLEAPPRVARGDAFVVRVVSDAALDNATFHWRGKQHTVKAERAGAEYVAAVLLAVPVDGEKGKALLLTVSVGKQQAQAEIGLYSKDRPVQKLNVDKKYVDPPAHEMERIKADREKVNVAMARFGEEHAWNLPLLRPVPGEISSQFGLRRVFNGQPRGVHKGLDMVAAEGAPILAAADGVVALADNLYFSGNAVYLDHGQGVYSAYLHMSQTHVQPGQKVRRGEVIGLVGSTGRVTAPHLHLTLLVQGVHVDPVPLMESAR